MASASLQGMPHIDACDSPFQALRDFVGFLLALLVFTIPWEDQFVVAGLGTLSRGVGMAAFAMGMLAAVASGQIRMPRPVHFVMLLFVMWGCLTSFWTVSDELTLIAIKTYAQLLAMVWLILEFAPRRSLQLRLLQAYVVGSCVSAAGTIASFLSGTTPYWQRHVAEGFDPNDLCVTLALSIPMSLYLSVAQPAGWQAWVWRLHPVPILFAALLTASRGGFVALCAALLIIPAVFRKLPTASKLLLPALAAALAIAVLTWLPASAWERLSSLPEETRAMTFGQRGEIWKAGWEVFREQPMVGVGIGAFALAVQSVRGEAAVAHNVFLTVLVETGLVGFLLLAAALCWLLDSAVHLAPLERRFWLVALITWFAGAMSLSWAHRKPTWLLFGLLAAQACRVGNRTVARGEDPSETR
jgi:O-antigen ligase